MISVKTSFLILSLLISVSVSAGYSGPNRIVKKVEGLKKGENPLRCRDIEQTKECPTLQKKRLQQGKISQAEYHTLVAANVIAVFDDDDFMGVCPCGCFDPSTRLSLYSTRTLSYTPMPISELVGKTANFTVLSLGEDAVFSLMTVAQQSIELTTSGPESEPLIYIHTDSGSVLGVTDNHAILLSSGKMIAAKDLKVGQELVTIQGKPTKIIKLEQRTIEENVINVLTSGKTLKSHVIGAEQIWVGDLAWQNSLAAELGAITVRE